MGAFTWAFKKGSPGFEEPLGEEVEGAPEVEQWKDKRRKDEKEGSDDDAEEEGEENSPRMGPREGERGEENSPRMGPREGETGEENSPAMGPQDGERDEEEEEDWEIKVFRMAAPLATKRSDEVLGVVMEFVLRLRADGYWPGPYGFGA